MISTMTVTLLQRRFWILISQILHGHLVRNQILKKGSFVIFTSLLISGPDLPAAVEGISIIQSANGILAIGGRYHDDEVDVWYTLKSIHSLSCNETECQWTKKGELNHARSYFSVFPIRPTGSRRITSGSRRITFLQPMLAMISLVISWF